MNKLLQKLDTVGLLLLVATVIRYSVNNVWDVWATVLGVLGAACAAAGLVANYKQIMMTLGKRSTKYFSNYVVSVALVLALVAGLNFLGQRHSTRIDMTAGGRYTLAPQTTQILQKLSNDIDIKVFFPGGDYPPMKELLTQFRGVSRHVRYEFVDPKRHPEVAKQYGVTEYRTFQNPLSGATLKTGTVLIMHSGRQEKIEKRDQEVREEDLTNAIIKVLRTETKTVYFVQGHGEKDLADTEMGGYSGVKAGLEKQGFKVATANLATAAKVPDDAKVLVIAGPKTEPFAKESEFVSGFLNRGGGVLVMVDPPQAASMAGFLKEWQITPDNNIILDVSGAGRLFGTGPAVPLVDSYESHAITDRFREMTFFPLARSIQPPKESTGGITATILFKSNERSWGETDFKNKQATLDEKTDLKGPLPMAVAVTKQIKPAADNSPAVNARMVVVGNSEFVANPYFEQQGNGNLFMNMVSWLARDEDLISIRPKAPEDRKILMSQGQQRMLQILVLFLLPGAVLVAGIIVWTRRRK
jgi:ABC-type uncharacterized transport system involved in gliding motility auxiliary subunit